MQKVKPIRDKVHLAFLLTLPCSRCGAYPSQASHIRRHGGGGTAYKSEDDRGLPQCHECHSLSHRIGEVSFYKDVYKAHELARALYLFSGNTWEALSIIARMRRDVYH